VEGAGAFEPGDLETACAGYDYDEFRSSSDESGSHATRRWREMDSNHWSPFTMSEHPPIIDHPLGDAVQAQLAGKVAQRNEGGRTRQPRP
jgi:hypothetical protein